MVELCRCRPKLRAQQASPRHRVCPEAEEFFGAGEARTPAAHAILDRLADVEQLGTFTGLGAHRHRPSAPQAPLDR